jgi:hypothetical protein
MLLHIIERTVLHDRGPAGLVDVDAIDH